MDPRLTEFCTALTGIAQEDLADAARFPEAIEAMKKWAYAYSDSLFSSCGDTIASSSRRIAAFTVSPTRFARVAKT